MTPFRRRQIRKKKAMRQQVRVEQRVKLIKEMDAYNLPEKFQKFLISYMDSLSMYRQHVAYNFLTTNLSSLEEHERKHFIIETMIDVPNFTEASIRQYIIETTDKWESTWLNMTPSILQYYFGNNPVIKAAQVLLA